MSETITQPIDVQKSRFRDASWFEKVETLKTGIVIGGAGGIGSWVVFFLSRILSNDTPIFLYDFDRVELVNMAGQFFEKKNVGSLKVDALIENIKHYSNYKSIHPMKQYDELGIVSPIMFSCFDNMKARKLMFEGWKEEAKKNPSEAIFIDGRLLAEQLQVFFVTPEFTEEYEKYLFDDSEVEDTSCSYKQTTHFAATIGAKMVQGFTNWISNEGTIPFYYEEIGNLFLTETK